MFTLIYFERKFNRPDTLLPFLESNVGKSPFMQIDCITPYQGNVQALIQEVCNYLNGIAPQIEVCYQDTLSKSFETYESGTTVNFLSIQLQVNQKSL